MSPVVIDERQLKQRIHAHATIRWHGIKQRKSIWDSLLKK